MARYLGLRLEEVSKVRPQDIDWTRNVDHLKRGTKGGRYRYVMLVTPEARAWAHELARQVPARDRGIIPSQYMERSWKSHVQREIRKAGGGRANGLRHTFAQDALPAPERIAPPDQGREAVSGSSPQGVQDRLQGPRSQSMEDHRDLRGETFRVTSGRHPKRHTPRHRSRVCVVRGYVRVM